MLNPIAIADCRNRTPYQETSQKIALGAAVIAMVALGLTAYGCDQKAVASLGIALGGGALVGAVVLLGRSIYEEQQRNWLGQFLDNEDQVNGADIEDIKALRRFQEMSLLDDDADYYPKSDAAQSAAERILRTKDETTVNSFIGGLRE